MNLINIRKNLKYKNYINAENLKYHQNFLIITIISLILMIIVYYFKNSDIKNSNLTNSKSENLNNLESKFLTISQNYLNKIKNFEQKTNTHNYSDCLKSLNILNFIYSTHSSYSLKKLNSVSEKIFKKSIQNVDLKLFNELSQGKLIFSSMRKRAKIDIVLAYYKYDLSWLVKMLKNLDKNSFRLIVYSKNKNFNNSTFDKFVEYYNLPQQLIPYIDYWIELDNIGREGHTYLYHIINNYKYIKNLSDKTFFVKDSGCKHMNIEWLKINLKNNLKINLKNNFENKYLFPIGPVMEQKPYNLDNFSLEEYYQQSDQNGTIDPFFKAFDFLRPFSKWCKVVLNDEKFNSDKIDKIIYCGNILTQTNFNKIPLDIWIKLGLSLTYASNIETGHYMERLWYYILS